MSILDRIKRFFGRTPSMALEATPSSSELTEKIDRSQEYYKVAVEIKQQIESQGAKIQSLSVAYSNGIAALSGIAIHSADRDLAADIAARHEGVGKVSNGIMDWPFDDPPNVAVITTVQVLEKGFPILRVSHDEDDGAWQFSCGTTYNTKDGRIVALSTITGLDLSIGELADLPLGWTAWRSSTAADWQRAKE